jgi:2'-5' RNA ligase
MSDQLSFSGFGAAPALTDGLFFAIFPDGGAAASIAQRASRVRHEHGLQGAPLRTERFHVSLLGVGEYPGLPQGIVAVASRAAMTIAAPPFDITLDRLVSFGGRRADRGTRPLVLCGGDGVAALMTFQQALGAAMAKAGLGRPKSSSKSSSKSSFSPHVTLLYDDRDVPEQPIEPVGWTAREFVLVHSLIGRTRYVPLGRWPLRA